MLAVESREESGVWCPAARPQPPSPLWAEEVAPCFPSPEVFAFLQPSPNRFASSFMCFVCSFLAACLLAPGRMNF